MDYFNTNIFNLYLFVLLLLEDVTFIITLICLMLGLIVFNYFIHIFNSFILSYDYKFIVEMIKEAFYSLVLVYLLKIVTVMIKYLWGYWNLIFNFNILSDIILIVFMALLIFPFMYIIAVVNEYMLLLIYTGILYQF